MFSQATTIRYLPRLLFDRNEPFLPRWVGVSILDRPGPSPSFRRSLSVAPGGLCIEYAWFWDWDIQHLYDLEHIWIFTDAAGRVCDAEASFHGRFLKSLDATIANLEGDRLTLYSQPGKHAFAPDPLVFRLLPDFWNACDTEAGRAGAEVPRPLQGRIVPEPVWDEVVRAYLQTRAFRPSQVYEPWSATPDQILPWEALDERLPELFLTPLRELSLPKG